MPTALILTQVSLIDFTASRLVSEGSGQLAFYDLSQDPEVFEGTQGDVQVRKRGGVALCVVR